MKPRDTLHLLLAIPALAGVGVAFALLSSAAHSDVSNRPFVERAAAAWSAIGKAVPTPMPGESFEMDTGTIDNIELLDDRQRRAFGRNDAFVASCAALVLAGLLGIALLGAATTAGESRLHPPLRVGAVAALALAATLLGGFHTAYPVEDPGWFAAPQFRLPGEIDSLAYGLGGVSEWTDLFFLAASAAFLGAVLLGPCCAGQTATSAFLVAIPAATLLFPVVVSWEWGGGWLESERNNYDFAGAALIHWHIGAATLVTTAVARLFRERRSTPTLAPAGPAGASIPLFLPSVILYFVAIVALNAGAAQEATPALVAPVLQATAIAAGAALLPALLWWRAAGTRRLADYLGNGLLGGAVSASGAADAMTAAEALAFGAAAGILVPGALFALDRWRWPDPTAVVAVHGVGGLVAALGTCSVKVEGVDASPLGQLTLLGAAALPSAALALFVVLGAGLSNRLFVRLPGGKPSSRATAA